MRNGLVPALLALLVAAPAAAETRAVGDTGWTVEAPQGLALLGSGPGNELLRWGRQWQEEAAGRNGLLQESETLEVAVERPKRAPSCANRDAMPGSRFGRPTLQYTCPPVGHGAPEHHFVLDLEGGGAIHVSYRHEWRSGFEAGGHKGLGGLDAKPRLQSPHMRQVREVVRSLRPAAAHGRVLSGGSVAGPAGGGQTPSCATIDTSGDEPRPRPDACAGTFPPPEAGMPPTPAGTVWRVRADAPHEYWTDIQFRVTPKGPDLQVPLDRPMLWRAARVGGGTWATIPSRPSEWRHWALAEAALGRLDWAQADARLGLALAPGEPSLQGLVDRLGPVPPGSPALAGTAGRAFETAHALYEHEQPQEALRWIEASLSLNADPQAARLRDRILAAAQRAGGAPEAETPKLLRVAAAEPAPTTAALGPRGEPLDEFKRGAPLFTRAEPIPKPLPPPASQPASPFGALVAMLTLGLGIGMVIVIFKPRVAAAPAAPAEPAPAAPRPQSQTPTVIDTLRAAARQGPAPSLSRYQVGRQIGAGGMGIVFEGTDRRLGRRVAIKQMRRELRDNPKDRENFLSEARIISRLSHPYIVAFHEVIEEGDELFLVFEFVDGEPLSRRLADGKRLPVAHAQRVFTQVCEAISCAHRAHVLHRDLKPANIMLGKDGYAKVMDFGIARQAKDTITRLTNTDASGTPAYMAPEQHLGRCNKASDIYALGVCLYESLTGQLPFKGPDFLAQKERMMYPPPQYLNPDLPKVAELLFQVTLAADPGKRVADAEELIESLKRLG